MEEKYIIIIIIMITYLSRDISSSSPQGSFQILHHQPLNPPTPKAIPTPDPPPPLVELVRSTPSQQMLTDRLHLFCPINIPHAWWGVGVFVALCVCGGGVERKSVCFFICVYCREKAPSKGDAWSVCGM